MPSSIGLFSQLYYQMNNDIKRDKRLKSAFGQAPNMCDKERQISFLNKYFIFKKVRQVDIENVYTKLINQSPADDVVDIKETIAAQEALEKEEIKLQSIDTLKTKEKSKLKTEIDLVSSSQEIESPKKTTIKSVKSVKSTKPKLSIKEKSKVLTVNPDKLESIKDEVIVDELNKDITEEIKVLDKDSKTKIKLKTKSSMKTSKKQGE